MKMELGPVRITRIIVERVRVCSNGSVDMDVIWEDATDNNNAKGMIHLHEREVGLIVKEMQHKKRPVESNEEVRFFPRRSGVREIHTGGNRR